ncbi:MAG: hypothetical protein DMF20_03025 [Verrucomicrobia bacterium]|nr:MAG: hypothetical protein DMF20_03025 [Verrucomicrobiota bacterium]
MLALLYLATILMQGACVCRRLYGFNSVYHYIAASFLVGLVLSTWATYLFALAFAWSNTPLLGANILFFALAGLVIYKLRPRSAFNPKLTDSRPSGSTVWDAFFIGCFILAACYLMFGTLWLKDGNARMASVVWNDFGPNLSLMQSFAVGHNFPTEYPHYIGEPIRYHFLFWFQAGNLEFLGLNMAWALNLLSVFSLLAMLILIMTLGELLFQSRVVGRIAASLFFFPTTLSYVPFLQSQHSLSQAFASIIHLNHWLVSGYPYKAEAVGTWSLSIFYVQRHFIVGIGVFLLVLTFLVGFCRQRRRPFASTLDGTNVAKASDAEIKGAEPEAADHKIACLTSETQTDSSHEQSPHQIVSFAFTGFLLGLLPLWNSAAFATAFAVVAVMLVLFPYRVYILSLLITAALVSAPQLAFLFLRDQGFTHGNSIIHWGLVVENPTLSRVLSYFCFTFGEKLLLGLAAVIFCMTLPRRLFIALLILPILAFSTQLSTDIINNHKFLYIWVLLLNLFAAYTIWRVGKIRWVGKSVAVALLLVVTFGGAIEWFRIHNDTIVDVPFRQNRLSEWLQANTSPRDVFLTDRFVIHPILLNGRRIFYGWPYFAWSMGYSLSTRDTLYGKLFTEKDPVELVRLLNENGIRYVAIDNGLRSGYLRDKLNEPVFKRYFETVFQDKENRFGALIIYRVPDRMRNNTWRAGIGDRIASIEAIKR